MLGVLCYLVQISGALGDYTMVISYCRHTSNILTIGLKGEVMIA